MGKIIETIIGDLGEKKEWKAIEARAKALPHDYHVVYEEIKQYLWKSSGLLGSPVSMFGGLVELFEEGAANGKNVLDITGPDVASFCDELVRGEKTYIDTMRAKLNSNVAKKLDK